MIKCPFCQFNNEDGALFCEQCKSDLASVTPAPAAGQGAAEAMPIAALVDEPLPTATPVETAEPIPFASAEPAIPVASLAESPMAVPVAEAPLPLPVPAMAPRRLPPRPRPRHLRPPPRPRQPPPRPPPSSPRALSPSWS